jgi:2-isopropylmalate synthase
LNGAGQVECTVNGIGERAGNCSMEEVVMSLRTRRDFYRADTNVNTREITRTSKLVTRITGIEVQPNKAIVGANAFAHEAGIHQDGLLKEKTTYEIISPESVGLLHSAKLVLGKHSGRHAFGARLRELGHDLGEKEMELAFQRFKELADQKKHIYDEDLETIVSWEITTTPEVWSLEELRVQSGTDVKPSATVRIGTREGVREVTASGDGPVDAAYRAIQEITGTRSRLERFDVKGITGGTDALGEVTVTLEEDGRTARGHGADTDILVAAAKAYIHALNRLEMMKN